MESKDYYKILGVSREASTDEVRKAYKKLARENHPDSKPGDAEASERFKQIQEAYAVLGDSEKREQYDRYGASFRDAGRGPFQQSWSGGGGAGGAGPVDFSDIFGGGFDLGDIFGSAAGGAYRGGRRASPARPGEDVQLEIEVPFHIAAEGGSHGVALNRDGKVERIRVKVPAGVDTGSIIRLAGEGRPGVGGGPAGDLKLTVKVAPHPWFRRDGANLLLDLPVTPAEAALGAKVAVPTLSEGNVTLTIPPHTSSGMKLRLREKGIVDSKTKRRGDQFAIVKIVLPKELTEEEQECYRRLSDVSTHSPREGLW